MLLALLVSATLAFALTFPTLSGRVVDEAGILDAAARASLTQKLEALEAKSTDQLVVVTLKSLQGTSIEDFGVQLGRAWKIGQKDKNNGVLLIVAPNERKVRIEVGRGLEGTITDAITRLIIENSIIPRFRANDFPGGIARGVDDIISAITDNDEWKQRAATTTRRDNTSRYMLPIILVLAFGMAGLAVVLIGIDFFRGSGTRSTRRGGGHQNNSWWSTSPSSSGSSGWSSGSSGGGGDSGGGFSGGGGDFGGGGSSGSW